MAPLLLDSRIVLTGVVLATDERWAIFHEALTGQPFQRRSLMTETKRLAKWILGRNPFDYTGQTLRLLARHNIPVIWCEDVNAASAVSSFTEHSPDLILSAAYPQIFEPELLSIAPRGAFNSHPSLLPRCRGANPVFWSIASGETVSGATIHYMTDKLDQGDIVAQIRVNLAPTDTYSELYDKLIKVVPELISQFVNFLVKRDGHTVPQDDDKATYFRNEREIHQRIFWSGMTAHQIQNLVRACGGNAFFWLNDIRIRVRRVDAAETNRNLTNNVTVPPGTIVDMLEGLPVVAAREGFVVFDKSGYPTEKVSFDIGQIIQ